MNPDPVDEKEFITPNNIFSKIWTAPKQVFIFINKYKYDKHVTLLLLLSGIARTFDRAAMRNMGDDFPLWGVIVFCIVIGGLVGWITYYFYAALISWVGRWLGGSSTTQSILRVLAYALTPSILALFFLIPQIIIYGNAIFQEEGDVVSAGVVGNVIFYLSLFAESVLAMWTFVLCVIGISEVQKFSIIKAVVNLILPAFVLVSILLILILVIQVVS